MMHGKNVKSPCFPWVLSKVTVFVLVALLFNQASCIHDDHFFTSLPKCEGSSLGDEAEIPRTFLSSSDLKNSTLETIPVKLTAQSNFSCGLEKGRVASLNASEELHNLSEILTLFRSGYLLHDKQYYSKDDYCVQSIHTRNGSASVSLKICEPRCSLKNNACIQKCCEPGKVWDLKDYLSEKVMACGAPGETKWKPFLHKNQHELLESTQADNVNVRFSAAHPREFCDSGFFLMTLKEYNGMEASPFRIMKNGKAIMKLGRNMWEDVPSDQYCVDGAMNFHSGNESVGHMADGFSGNEVDTVMLVCTGFLEDPEMENDGSTNYLYVVAMLVASVFLFLTIVVYVILWKRQNVHGWTFMGYLASLLLTFLFLSTAHLATGEYDCTFIGIACHFFFISCFSWLTALNFDVYWTFRSLNPNPGRSKEIMRFLCYSAFAVGLPVIIVSVGLILQEIYGDDPESDVIVPRYGVTRCTLDRSADLPYLFGPISVLLACNLILFPFTLYQVYRSQKIAKLSGMKSTMLNHKIRFFGKLFMLAGITWIFEVISWACTEPGKPVHWIWKFLDLVNILQAIAIFVVFVCNPKTLHDLSEKFPRLKRINTIIEKASGVAGGSTARKHSNTNFSTVIEAPGGDTVELH